MRMLTGTSGYSYKEWVGPFDPEKTPASAMLRYYAERLPTVEINNTFYRMPDTSLLERWAREVPEGFAFTLKAPQRITHVKRLKDVAPDVAEFTRRAAVLGGPARHAALPAAAVPEEGPAPIARSPGALPPGQRAALEFRHDSWQDDEVYGTLRARGAALCVTDTHEDGVSPFVCTSEDAYLRLRRTQYTESDLGAWADRIAAQPLARAWIYFKHEDEALVPRFARQLGELWRTSHGPV